MIGLDLADLAVDGCTTKAVCGGECAGRSPVDRGRGGLKRSQLTEGGGVPLATVSAPANIRDDALLPATLDGLKDFAPLPAEVTVHLDAGYDYRRRRAPLDERGLRGEIAHRGEPAPIQVGRRWVVERTNSWLNDFGKLRRCTGRPAYRRWSVLTGRLRSCMSDARRSPPAFAVDPRLLCAFVPILCPREMRRPRRP